MCFANRSTSLDTRRKIVLKYISNFKMNEHLRSLIVFQLELDQEQDKVGDFYFCAAIGLDAAQSIEPHPEADFTNLR